jgi:hypothetical protein
MCGVDTDCTETIQKSRRHTICVKGRKRQKVLISLGLLVTMGAEMMKQGQRIMFLVRYCDRVLLRIL